MRLLCNLESELNSLTLSLLIYELEIKIQTREEKEIVSGIPNYIVNRS